MKAKRFDGTLVEIPVWIPITKRLPTAKDADRLDRVWVIVNANHNLYPAEAYWKHVRDHAKRKVSLYTHWAVPPIKTWKFPEEK